MPRTAEEIFDDFTERFGWDFEIQQDVLVNWCGESLIEPLLRYIQEAGQTDYFQEFLEDNFGDPKSEAGSGEEPDWRKSGF
jgi:hypothetical protein